MPHTFKCWGCGGEISEEESILSCPKCGREAELMERIGFEKDCCPKCGANLFNGVCLNACHLSKSSVERFSRLLAKLTNVENVSD